MKLKGLEVKITSKEDDLLTVGSTTTLPYSDKVRKRVQNMNYSSRGEL